MYYDKYFKKHEGRDANYSSSSAKIIDFESFSNLEQTTQNELRNGKAERSNKWYFEIGYQQSFSISVFGLTFIFA